jgi:hypothetical protein
VLTKMIGEQNSSRPFLFLAIIGILCGCDKWTGNDVVTEIAVADLMLNNLTLVARYGDKPDKLAKVFRVIAQDWVNAERAPDRNQGDALAYDLTRIDLTKKAIVECIGDDGFQQYVRGRRLHDYLADEIETQLGASVVDRNKVSEMLFESVSGAKKEARSAIPAEHKWDASANLIALCLENLDAEVAQSSQIGRIKGAQEAIRSLLSEQIQAVAENGNLVDTLMDEIRAVYSEGKVSLNDQ